MRKTDRLQALFDFFYDSMPTVSRGTGRFFVDDRRLQGWQTPADFNMEDGDEVDVYTELLGGRGWMDRSRSAPDGPCL
jgi:small ubiquitin-related modifier